MSVLLPTQTSAEPTQISVQIRIRGAMERIIEPPWARCLQGAGGARWVVVVVVVACCRRLPRGGRWTNREIFREEEDPLGPEA